MDTFCTTSIVESCDINAPDDVVSPVALVDADSGAFGDNDGKGGDGDLKVPCVWTRGGSSTDGR